MIEYGRNTIGPGARIFEPVTIGFPSRDRIGCENFRGAIIGKNALIRSGTTIYCDVEIGDDFQCGHNVLIRERTRIGSRVAVGTATIIEGDTAIGRRRADPVPGLHPHPYRDRGRGLHRPPRGPHE